MNREITRRNFIKAAALSVTAAVVTGGPIIRARGESVKKVVIAGGGYGGSSTAKYLKLLNPAIDVTLVDAEENHVSCPLSNEVVAGYGDLAPLTVRHSVLTEKYGVKFVQATITGLDPRKKKLNTTAGDASYDKLVISPGIGYVYDEKNGFDKNFQNSMPSGWRAGKETLKLRDDLMRFPKGGTALIRTPAIPYRCPIGPYERACLIADTVRKKGGHLTVIDPNPDIAAIGPLFKAAFKELYGGIVEYIPSVTVTGYDATGKKIKTDKGDFTADFINFIPDQRAADLAFELGTVPKDFKWIPVKPSTFETQVYKDVYAIGDSIYSERAGDIPKSAVIANCSGKFVADIIASEFAGRKGPENPVMGNACYARVSPEEAIWIAEVFAYDPGANKITLRKNAASIASKRSAENGRNAASWGINIIEDTFL